MHSEEYRSPIYGEVYLYQNPTVIPVGGLTGESLRVDILFSEDENTGWISEVKNKGEVPWRRGETRPVELRLLTEKTHEKRGKIKVNYFLESALAE